MFLEVLLKDKETFKVALDLAVKAAKIYESLVQANREEYKQKLWQALYYTCDYSLKLENPDLALHHCSKFFKNSGGGNQGYFILNRDKMCLSPKEHFRRA